ncbi:cell division cycle 25 [Chamberlinius hualienensis]
MYEEKMAEDKAQSFKRPSWKYSPNSSLGISPMTRLAINLEESTRFNDTPKRRISWSNESSFSSPDVPRLLSSNSEDVMSSSPVGMNVSPVFTLTVGGDRVLNNDTCNRIPYRSTPILKSRLMSISSLKLFDKENVCRDTLAGDSNKLNDEQDCSSRDSGFSEKQEETFSDFIFTEPVGVPLRKLRSPTEESPKAFDQKSGHSLLTTEPDVKTENDEISMNGSVWMDSSVMDEDANSPDEMGPSGLTQLIKGKLSSTSSTHSGSEIVSTITRPPFHDICNINVDTPKAKNCIRGLFGASKSSGDDKSYLKRHELLRESPSPVQTKRRKNGVYQRSESAQMMEEIKILPKKPHLQRAYSETHADIMRAVQISVQDPSLIGDCSKPFLLPLIDGRHQDLRTISHETVKALLLGSYDNELGKYLIVDCRYPYEYEGGHIKGAINTYTKEGIISQFLCNPIKVQESSKRLIIIFHCEFSSERAPNLSRFLRNRDREANKECYPQLYYPEIYVIEGGYKMFFEHNRHLCEPQNYLPMLHKDHECDLRFFRAKSKSWNSEKGNLRFGRPTGFNI